METLKWRALQVGDILPQKHPFGGSFHGGRMGSIESLSCLLCAPISPIADDFTKNRHPHFHKTLATTTSITKHHVPNRKRSLKWGLGCLIFKLRLSVLNLTSLSQQIHFVKLFQPLCCRAIACVWHTRLNRLR